MTVTLTDKQKERTRKNLIGVHPHLVQVVERALELSTVPFVVTEGLRTLDRQKKLKAAGKSWTLNSRHLTGHAVDVVDADDFGYDIPDMTKIKVAMFDAASELGVPLVWGGDWKQRDTPHFELDKRSYPASGVGTGTKVLEVAGKVAANRAVQTTVTGATATAVAKSVADAPPAPVPDPSAWTTLPAPPEAITNNINNAGAWKGMGETVVSLGSFAWGNPVFVSCIVATVAILVFGPRLARRFGWAG